MALEKEQKPNFLKPVASLACELTVVELRFDLNTQLCGAGAAAAASATIEQESKCRHLTNFFFSPVFAEKWTRTAGFTKK